MRTGIKLIMMCLSVILLICFSGCSEVGEISKKSSGNTTSDSPSRNSAPVVLPVDAPGDLIVEDEKAILDYSNKDQGYICARSLIAPTVVKVLVEVSDTQYQYSLMNSDNFVTIPISEGDGDYAVSFWENLYDDQYAAVFSQDIEVSMPDPFLPFLRPNQFVNYKTSDKAVVFSQELTKDADGDVAAISDVYLYVIKNISYDFDKAATVAHNYLPVIDETLETKKGICFDYSVLMASMLRAQRIPTKLVIGYAGSAYHAWVEVYSSEEGWIKKEIHFDGTDYTLMDPTFASAGGGQIDMSSIIGDGSNYNPRFYY